MSKQWLNECCMGVVTNIVKKLNIIRRPMLRALMLRPGFPHSWVDCWTRALHRLRRHLFVAGTSYGDQSSDATGWRPTFHHRDVRTVCPVRACHAAVWLLFDACDICRKLGTSGSQSLQSCFGGSAPFCLPSSMLFSSCLRQNLVLGQYYARQEASQGYGFWAAEVSCGPSSCSSMTSSCDQVQS